MWCATITDCPETGYIGKLLYEELETTLLSSITCTAMTIIASAVMQKKR